jgi:hypothetical protein
MMKHNFTQTCSEHFPMWKHKFCTNCCLIIFQTLSPLTYKLSEWLLADTLAVMQIPKPILAQRRAGSATQYSDKIKVIDKASGPDRYLEIELQERPINYGHWVSF